MITTKTSINNNNNNNIMSYIVRTNNYSEWIPFASTKYESRHELSVSIKTKKKIQTKWIDIIILWYYLLKPCRKALQILSCIVFFYIIIIGIIIWFVWFLSLGFQLGIICFILLISHCQQCIMHMFTLIIV